MNKTLLASVGVFLLGGSLLCSSSNTDLKKEKLETRVAVTPTPAVLQKLSKDEVKPLVRVTFYNEQKELETVLVVFDEKDKLVRYGRKIPGESNYRMYPVTELILVDKRIYPLSEDPETKY